MSYGPRTQAHSGSETRGGDHDVVIVGGGPAGLATALALRQRGLGVRVVDRRKPTADESSQGQPSLDKPCGEGLMPDGAAVLRDLGVDPSALRSHPFRGIRWLDAAGHEVDGRFPAAPGLGIRRTELHGALVEAAEAAGVELTWGERVEGLTEEGIQTSRGAVRARWVVGADGLRSKVRTWAGLDAPGRRRGALERFGVRRHYALTPWTDRVEVHWGAGCEAYVTPTAPAGAPDQGDAPGEVGVAILWSGRKAGFDELLAGLPELAARLEGARQISRDLGIGPLRHSVRDVVDPRARVALVGDAAGYVDAITGEGLSVALHQAVALADAIADDDLVAYRRAHRSIVRLPNALIELVLFLERTPSLRRRCFRALARDPGLFERFLAVHVRHAPARSLGPLGPRIVWRLMTA